MFGKAKKKTSDKPSRFDSLNGATEIDNRFRWHQMIYIFIQELNLTEEQVYKKNYISCLNWLSFFKQKNEVEKNKQKENKK